MHFGQILFCLSMKNICFWSHQNCHSRKNFLRDDLRKPIFVKKYEKCQYFLSKNLQFAEPQIRHFLFHPKSTDNFLISPLKHMLWYSLEVPYRGTSNEYPQCMFSWRNKKIFCVYPHLNLSRTAMNLSRNGKNVSMFPWYFVQNQFAILTSSGIQICSGSDLRRQFHQYALHFPRV